MSFCNVNPSLLECRMGEAVDTVILSHCSNGCVLFLKMVEAGIMKKADKNLHRPIHGSWIYLQEKVSVEK